MQSFCYTIEDALGIHARPAGMLVKEANGFSCAVRLKKGEETADAKKIFAVMKLAVKCKDTLTVECDGADEEAACTALKTFFKTNL